MNAISVNCKIGTAGVERQQRVKLLLLRNRKKVVEVRDPRGVNNAD